MELSPIEARILGCLVEKELTTPEYYPLTINSLMLACNQKSNRSPVLGLSEKEVQANVESLKNKHLLWERREAGARALKYEHNLSGIGITDRAECAVLCELFVRGAQTPGELRARGTRMHPFRDLAEVEQVLDTLAKRTETPLVAELPRVPGTKETRYAHLLSGEPEAFVPIQSTGSPESYTPRQETTSTVALQNIPKDNERIELLEEEVAMLREEVARLKQRIEKIESLVN